MTATCEHCGLPVGRLGERREVGGDDHWFCCYGCCLAYQVHHGAREDPEAASLLVRLGVGAFLAMNIMLFSLLLYSGALERPDGDGAGGGLTALVHGLLWVLASALLVVLGGPFLRGAWQGARARRLTADALVSLGALAAYLYSAGQVVLGSGQVYFDTAAMVLGIGQAAERGVLIRGAGVLERLARLRGVAFDKTGTLTAGRLRPVALNAEGASEPQVLRLAHALALASSHPLARAIVAHGKHTGVSARPAANAWEHPGAGVTGLIDGSPAALGSASLVAALGWPAPQALIEAPLPEGAVPVYVAWGGRTRGRLTLADADRPEAGEVVAALGRHGLATLLLSGDSPRAVARTAARLGIATWHAGLTPEAKADVLRDWAARHGPIAMVGDGLNDAPVLAAAAVGIAVGDAADLAKESADVVIPAGGLATLPWLLGLARDVRRSVRANLLWAFGYNTVALTLAVCGLLRPVFAAGLMAGSSLMVVLRSLRASRAGRALGTSPDRPAPTAPAPDACGARACARRPAAQPPLSA